MEKLRTIIRHPRFIDWTLAVGLTLSLSMLGLLFYNSYRVFRLLAQETRQKIELMELKSEIGKGMEGYSRYTEMYVTTGGKSWYDDRLELEIKLDSAFHYLHTFVDDRQEKLFETIDLEWRNVKQLSGLLTSFSRGTSEIPPPDTTLQQQFHDFLIGLQEKIFLISPYNEEEIILADLSCEISYRDEALTTFAYQYVQTLSPRWMIRYKSYANHLSDLFRKLEMLLPNNESVKILLNADDEMGKLEKRAFAMALAKDTIAALQTLNNQNAQYHRGRMAKSIQAIQKIYRERLTSANAATQTRETIRIMVGFIFLVFSWLLLAIILRLRRQLEARNKELSKKNRDLEQFAYAVSHDLKAPLRIIGGLSGAIERSEGHKLSQDGLENFSLIKEQTEQMNRMISGVLEYARATHGAGLAEKINVNEIVEEIIKPYRTLSEVQFTVSEKMPIVKAPRATVVQIFQNLINNALKYNDKPIASISIEAVTAGKFVEFSISDNGPGIAPEFSDKIFRLFDTLAPKSVESTGVGLAIVKKYIEDMEGTIHLDPTFTGGARFVFTLPNS